jgi:TPR repeat protein
LQLVSDGIAILIKRGKDLLADGDLAAARLLLRRAAEAGSAEGAFALGTTFDPVALQRLGAIGAVPDLAQARQWYQRAAELGSSAASQQLAGLGDDR